MQDAHARFPHLSRYAHDKLATSFLSSEANDVEYFTLRGDEDDVEYFTLRTNDFTRKKCATLDTMHRIISTSPHTFGKFEWEAKNNSDFLGGFTCKSVMRVPLSIPIPLLTGAAYASGRELLFCGFETTLWFLPFVKMPQLIWLRRIGT